MNKYKSQAIAVYFDGVIAEFSDGIEEFGKPIPGAKEAIAELRRLGYKIIIHTAVFIRGSPSEISLPPQVDYYSAQLIIAIYDTVNSIVIPFQLRAGHYSRF
jgi:hypothetical protein